MCTLAVAYFPETPTPIIVVANRDENPSRPAQPWKWRWDKKAYCPLDVLGGTWIGINSLGFFCAITNWDIEYDRTAQHRSRGLLVTEILSWVNTKEELDSYILALNPKEYKPFNIIAGYVDTRYRTSWLASVTGDGNSIISNKLDRGLHISTGQGFNNKKFERDRYIRKVLKNNYEFESVQPIRLLDMQDVLKSHHAGFENEDSACQHDESHQWETRSQSYIMIAGTAFGVGHADGHPCLAEGKKDVWSYEGFSYSR